jgi:hypothetical protein
MLHPMSENEVEALAPAVALAVRLRGAVERDRRTRELDAVQGAEGAARLWLTLEQTFGGLLSLGIARETALATVRSIALDSVPPQRIAAYRLSRPEEFHPRPLAERCVNLSIHTAPIR